MKGENFHNSVQAGKQNNVGHFCVCISFNIFFFPFFLYSFALLCRLSVHAYYCTLNYIMEYLIIHIELEIILIYIDFFFPLFYVCFSFVSLLLAFSKILMNYYMRGYYFLLHSRFISFGSLFKIYAVHFAETFSYFFFSGW